MTAQRSTKPSLTAWPVEIVHGVRDTDEGPRGGWGWLCFAHPLTLGLHGYPNDIEALIALRDHLGVCRGRTV